MIDGSEERNCQLAFELHNSHVCEKRCKTGTHLHGWSFCWYDICKDFTNGINVDVKVDVLSIFKWL